MSTISEIHTRGGSLLIISQEQIKDYDCIILPKLNNNMYTALLSIIPFQYMALKIASENKLNVDYPRNLAKCVTVE